MLRKNKIVIVVILLIAIVILSGIIIYRVCYTNTDLQYSQEYIAGTANIKGNVDTQYFSDKGEEFNIGANRYGYAVFKNPDAAFSMLKTDYKDGIKLIQEEFSLQPLSQDNYEIYGTYGWQVTIGTAEEKEQANFITDFMDIYENSFHKQ